MEVFAYSGTISPELAAKVEAELADQEVAAVATARPTPYVHDVLAACRESGRTVAVVSNNSERAVLLYLTGTAWTTAPANRRPHQPRPRAAQARARI